MDRTYNTIAQGNDHGVQRTSPDIITGADGRPDIVTIQETYHTLFRYLKLSTLDGFNYEKPKPPDVFPNLDFPQLTDPHDSAPGEGDDDMSFWDWVLAILRFILWIAAIAVWLATILPAILLDLGTYLPRLGAYYGIELPLFYMIKAERALLVMTGYLHPMQDEIDMGLIQIGNNNHGNFLALLSAIDDILGTELAGTRPAEPVPDPNFPPHQTEFEEGELLALVFNKSSKEYLHRGTIQKRPSKSVQHSPGRSRISQCRTSSWTESFRPTKRFTRSTRTLRHPGTRIRFRLQKSRRPPTSGTRSTSRRT